MPFRAVSGCVLVVCDRSLVDEDPGRSGLACWVSIRVQLEDFQFVFC